MKKIILVIAIGVLSISAYSQQQQDRHEFSVWGGGGISTFMYDLTLGDRSTGFGAIGGLGYNYFLTYNWSIGIGAEFSLLNAKTKLSPFSDTYDTPYGPSNGDLYRMNFQGLGFDQSQRGYYINIPLQVKYQMDAFWNKNHKLYAAIGPKIGIPVKTLYNTAGSVRVTGVELNAHNEPITTDWFGKDDNLLINRGFGMFSYDEKKKDLNLGVNVIASIEAGVKWRLSSPWSLYTGLYFDYGLNDLRKDKGQQLFEYEQLSSPVQYASNSILSSQHVNTRGVKTDFTDRVNTLALGIKVQVAYGTKPFDKKEKVKKALNAMEERPYEGLTAAQLEDIMGRNAQEMMEFQRKEFEALKELLKKEAPELAQAIINFDLNKKEILPSMHPELDRKVELMNTHPTAKLMLEGHTDDLGSMEYNFQLGMDRAQATKDYLVKKGIDPARLMISSKGKTQPTVPNTDDVNRYRNRRVEFILIQ